MDQRTAHQTVTQTLGKTIFTWSESAPLEFETATRDAVGEPEYRLKFSLAQLTNGFEESFLLALKDLIMQRFLKVRVRTMKNEYASVRQLFNKIQSDQTSTDLSKHLMEANRISVIDTGLMIAVRKSWLRTMAGFIGSALTDSATGFSSPATARSLRTWNEETSRPAIVQDVPTPYDKESSPKR